MKQYKKRDWLYRKYWVEGLPIVEIAKKMGRSEATVYRLLKKLGIPTRIHTKDSRRKIGEAKTGKKHPNWKGGRRKGASGYIRIFMPNHPFANNEGYVYEHRLVMEETLGRYLEPNEVVHHRNKIKDDNRPENLRHFESNVEHMQHEKDLRKSREAYF